MFILNSLRLVGIGCTVVAGLLILADFGVIRAPSALLVNALLALALGGLLLKD